VGTSSTDGRRRSRPERRHPRTARRRTTRACRDPHQRGSAAAAAALGLLAARARSGRCAHRRTGVLLRFSPTTDAPEYDALGAAKTSQDDAGADHATRQPDGADLIARAGAPLQLRIPLERSDRRRTRQAGHGDLLVVRDPRLPHLLARVAPVLPTSIRAVFSFVSSVSFATARTGWAVLDAPGSGVDLFETTDVGEQWHYVREIHSDANGAYGWVRFVSATVSWAGAGDIRSNAPSTLLRTTDGGRAWETLPGVPSIGSGSCPLTRQGGSPSEPPATRG